MASDLVPPLTSRVETDLAAMNINSSDDADLLLCRECGMGFEDKATFLRHMSMDHFKCTACNFTTTEESEFSEHVRKAHMPPPPRTPGLGFKCHYCRFSSRTLDKYKEHKKNC